MGDGVFGGCAPTFTVYYTSGKTGWTNPWYTYVALNSNTIDKTAPTITITSPTEGLLTKENVTLAYTVTDDVSAPSKISTSPASGTVYSAVGSYNIIIVATDEAKNTASKSVSFTITPPYQPITGNPEVDTAMGVLNNKYTDPETGRATHGTYVSAVTKKVAELRAAGKITKEQGGEIVKKAAQSSVNMPK
jgi:hypothetical protein